VPPHPKDNLPDLQIVPEGKITQRKSDEHDGGTRTTAAARHRLARAGGGGGGGGDNLGTPNGGERKSNPLLTPGGRPVNQYWDGAKSEVNNAARLTKTKSEAETWNALNEVIVDNAKSTSLTNIDCYCDGVFTTKCQGDGLIVATATGSTAYSLSAGGSMVHPQVPGILFTPVCPHSLSFRPIVFPDTCKISIRVSEDARSEHSVAFDGRGRQTLNKGDTVHVSVSSWPVPAICRVSETEDWFTGVRSLLHWNLRTQQKKTKE